MANGTNDNAIVWSGLPAGTDPTHAGMWTALTGGTFIGGRAITTNVPGGTSFRLAAGALDINLTTGDLSEPGNRRAIAGVIDGGIYVSLHTSSPGTNGANEVSGGSYARQSVPGSRHHHNLNGVGGLAWSLVCIQQASAACS